MLFLSPFLLFDVLSAPDGAKNDDSSSYCGSPLFIFDPFYFKIYVAIYSAPGKSVFGSQMENSCGTAQSVSTASK